VPDLRKTDRDTESITYSLGRPIINTRGAMAGGQPQSGDPPAALIRVATYAVAAHSQVAFGPATSLRTRLAPRFPARKSQEGITQPAAASAGCVRIRV
jgi:hypothetical protein